MPTQPRFRPGASSGRQRPDPGPEVSVVVPVHKNRDTLVELLDRLDGALGDESREVVLVVDGSPDDSLDVLLDQLEGRPHLVVLELASNFGQHAALCAGFAAARGRVALILDADLQQRPEDLPRFLEEWRAGHDFVSGWRTSRRDSLSRRIASFFVNRIARTLTGVRLHDWGCPIAAVDRSILDAIPSHGEKRRFLKPLVASLSKRSTEVRVEGQERRGASSYSFLTLFGVALDFVVSFTNRPFQRLAGLGFVSFAFGLVLGLGYVALRLFGVLKQDSPPIQALAAIAVLMGLQILILGALGEFTHRIYRLVQGRPFYQVAAVHRAEQTGGDLAEADAS
ncbi:MAG: glycosyltransferase family 2 protein [Planctomycetota bacterium]|nr:glycosyltransferase family 2 protein [Planctomycetota bacterium]